MSLLVEAFFVEERGLYVPTESTRGPWSALHQHGGPPAALMTRALERIGLTTDEAQLARLSVEFLRPVPLAPLRLDARVLRPGKKVELGVVSLYAGADEVARATGLKIRKKLLALPEVDVSSEAFEPPSALTDFVMPFSTGEVGYHTAMQLRLARGVFGGGKVAGWFRMRHPLLAGEAPSPAQRVAIAADSGNGISAVLDFSRWVFINPDLSVHLFRQPAGEWVLLDSRTLPAPNGVGLTDTRLYDEKGWIGSGCQSLLIDERRDRTV
jgi:hypothetical protein